MERTSNPQAWTIAAEVAIIYKTKVKPSQRPAIKCSRDAYELLIKTWDENKIELVEQFKLILLNRANKVLGISELSSGGSAGTVADPKIVFMTALKANACSLMITHNHPSGNLQPSKADEELTDKIASAAKLLDLRLLDHIIVTCEGYFSFADQGLL